MSMTTKNNSSMHVSGNPNVREEEKKDTDGGSEFSKNQFLLHNSF